MANKTNKTKTKTKFRGPTSQKRCKIGKKNAKTMCEKYNVSLDEQRGKLCFEVYHTKQ